MRGGNSILYQLLSNPLLLRQAIVNSNAEVTKGESARMSSFVGAIAIADLVKTTLGPKGMDKILQSVRARPLLLTLTLRSFRWAIPRIKESQSPTMVQQS
jgi:hypothetical protein